MSETAIGRLGALIGLARGYWAISGQWREPADLDRAAILNALGWDTSNDAKVEAEIDRFERSRWERNLPPAAVIAAGRTSEISIVLGGEETPAWRLKREDEGSHIGSTHEAPVTETRSHNGKTCTRRVIALPPLPPGYHRLTLDGSADMTLLIAVPDQCYLPPRLEGNGRVWGLSLQLYSIRSRRNWGIGDYTDLAQLARLAGEGGADVLGINPLHARSFSRPEACSPYSPVSRLAIDTFPIDPEAILEYALARPAQELVASAAFQANLRVLRDAPLVDYAGVAGAKLPVLRLIYAWFQEFGSAERRAAFDLFNEAGGEAILRYAQFEALRTYHDAKTGPVGWWDWPEAPERNAPELGDEVGFQLWLQFIADEQVRAASDAGHAAGMAIGVYSDMAVGAARDSAEAWAAPSLASPLSVGAPPDALAPQGQNWGVPAPDPFALEMLGFAPFTALLRANMRRAGALRIDHAMALARLFVIPPGRTGDAGTYLAYPFEAMTGILALESSRTRCVVVGEDLGTVPDGFREAMAARAILSYRVLYFERYPDGAFRAPADFPALSLATASTHDLPPLAGLWSGRDIEIAAGIGIISDPAAAANDRLTERHRFITLFDWQKVTPEPPPNPESPVPTPQGVLDAMHRLVGSAASKIAMVQIDDILAETEPVNVPGTADEYPNWRRKLSLSLEDEEFVSRFRATAAFMSAARPRN